MDNALMLKNRIQSLLKTRKISAYRFIKETGIGATLGYELAKNPDKIPSVAIIDKICGTYKVQPSEIVYWIENS